MIKILAVVAHHLAENEHYLKLTVDRLLMQYGANKEFELTVKVYSSSPSFYDLKEPFYANKRVFISHAGDGQDGEPPAPIEWYRNCTSKYNMAIKHEAYKYDRVIFCNDDICPQLNAIQSMLKHPDNVIVNVLSNSDVGGLIAMKFPVPNKYTLNDMNDHDWAQLNSGKPIANIGCITPMVPMFFTMVSSKVLNMVGLLDEELDSGGNDEEWCHRARAKGFVCGITMESVCIHFNHRTMMHTTTPDEEKMDMKLARRKMFGTTMYRPTLTDLNVWPKPEKNESGAI